MKRTLLVGLGLLVANAVCVQQLFAQAGLRESLERLDRNENGEIEPDEITPLARPYLERVAKARRMSLDRPNRIDRWQEAARTYYATKNGVYGKEVDPEGGSTIKPLRPDRDQPLVPEFGLAEVKYLYTQDDLKFVDRTMRSHDENKDGYIDRREAARHEWTHRNPFDDDLDKDGRLSRLEMAQRYARRRLLDDASDELVKKTWRTGSGVRPSRPDEQERRDSSQYWRRGGTRYYLTATVLSRFDTNKNGRLESQEAAKIGIPTGRIDVDRDGELTREELQDYFLELQDQAGGLEEGVPGWFYELDADRDQQISMTEFTTEWTDEKLQEFAGLDVNDDGLLTAPEILAAKSAVGGSYANKEAEVLPPRKTIISEIEVDDDYLIGDLNVQLSITHTYVSRLDAYLTGPDGQRVELFTEVGGSDDHFDHTVLDDQSRYPITKARPPFKGTFMPEGMAKRQPSLSHFNGKSVKGVWQLVIRGTRSERFGMLHSWSLIVTPQDDMLDAPAPNPPQDGPDPNAVNVSSSRPDLRQIIEARESEARAAADRARAEQMKLWSKAAKADWSVKNESFGKGGSDEERAKIEARKQAFERYKAYLENRKRSEGEGPRDPDEERRKLEAIKQKFFKDK